ncbi:hypothetical protein GQ54DRAFT_298056 [Martensiomyces pterosporus]|nr:hypothetical protein GQ54DRAFT_298056 [Martensiomyces pterosporus]
MKAQQLLSLLLALGTTARAQFAFSLDDTNADAIYSDIAAAWNDWASAGNAALNSAKADYPDAWAQLTDIYGADSLPGILNVSLAKHAATKLAGVQHTTVWDKNAGDHGDYTFSVRDLSLSGVPTQTGAQPGTGATSGSGSEAATPTATGSDSKSRTGATPRPTSAGSGTDSPTNGSTLTATDSKHSGKTVTGSGSASDSASDSNASKTAGSTTTSKPSSSSKLMLTSATLSFIVYVFIALALSV